MGTSGQLQASVALLLGKRRRYPFNRRLDGSQNPSGSGSEEKEIPSSSLPGIEPRYRSARGSVSIVMDIVRCVVQKSAMTEKLSMSSSCLERDVCSGAPVIVRMNLLETHDFIIQHTDGYTRIASTCQLRVKNAYRQTLF
jgi:hypothetical protein